VIEPSGTNGAEPAEQRHRESSDIVPLQDAALDLLAERAAAGSVIVGVGESTRFSHETFTVRSRLLQRLAEHHGFRALAVQDDAAAAAALDAYVTGADGTAEAALAGTWRPWRTAEMVATLEWIRCFNQRHPGDPVRIFGVKPTRARPADYDAVLEWVRQLAPERWAELSFDLDPIRTAYDLDEHVQRARGSHPGGTFADRARHALATVRSLPGVDADDPIVVRMRLILDHHERSVAGRGSYTSSDAEEWADAIEEHQRRTGRRVIYWDGIAHTSAAPVVLGLAAEREPRPTVGTLLRERHHEQYVSVAIGFHHGDLGVVVPEPAADLVDSTLGEVDLPAHWLDLRTAENGRRWSGPAKLRVISGVYHPSRDAVEHMTVGSLTSAFDLLVHIRETTAVHHVPHTSAPRHE
jgi:erythromycin esterase